MPENAGLYQKFNVRRRGGKKPNAAYFVLDVVNDPHALAALEAYRQSCIFDLPKLSADLHLLVVELQNEEHGPMVKALRTPL